MLYGSDIGRNHQDVVFCEFHECPWRNETINGNRSPANTFQYPVHTIHCWYLFDIYSSKLQSLHVRFMGNFLQMMIILTHHITPYRLVNRRIGVVGLVNYEL
jgi:hypothetical protein